MNRQLISVSTGGRLVDEMTGQIIGTLPEVPHSFSDMVVNKATHSAAVLIVDAETAYRIELYKLGRAGDEESSAPPQAKAPPIDDSSLNAESARKLVAGKPSKSRIARFALDSRPTDFDLSRNGQMVASTHRDGSLFLHDLESGQSRRINAHRGAAFVVRFSPDGSRCATCGEDLVLRLWSVFDGAEMANFRGHLDRVTDVDFDMDGSFLYTASRDCTVKKWDIRAAIGFSGYRSPSDSIGKVGYSANGRVVGALSTEGTLRLWDSHTNSEMRTIPNVSCFAFHPQQAEVAVGSGGHIERISLSTFDGLQSDRLYDRVISLHYSPDIDKLLAFGVMSDAKSRFGRRVFILNSQDLSQDLSWKGRSLAIAARFVGENEVPLTTTGFIWNTKGPFSNPKTPWDSSQKPINATVSSDGRLIAAAFADSTIEIYEAKTAKRLLSLGRTKYSTRGSANDLAFSPEGDRLVVLRENGTRITLYSTNAGTELTSIPTWRSTGIRFAPNGHSLALSRPDGRVVQIDLGTTIREVTLHNYSLSDEFANRHLETKYSTPFRLSFDERWIARGRSDGSITIWNAQTGHIAHEIDCSLNRITDLAFAPNNATLAVTSVDGFMRLYSQSSMQLVGEKQVDEFALSRVAFVHSGSRLFTQSWVGTLELWNARDLTESICMPDDQPIFDTVRFNEDTGEAFYEAGQTESGHQNSERDSDMQKFRYATQTGRREIAGVEDQGRALVNQCRRLQFLWFGGSPRITFHDE